MSPILLPPCSSQGKAMVVRSLCLLLLIGPSRAVKHKRVKACHNWASPHATWFKAFA